MPRRHRGLEEDDGDKDAYINTRELRNVLAHLLEDQDEPLTDEELDEIVVDVGMDGDGNINYDEFVMFMDNWSSGNRE